MKVAAISAGPKQRDKRVASPCCITRFDLSARSSARRADCLAVDAAFPSPPKLDRPAQRLPPAIFSNGNEFPANLAGGRAPGDDEALFRLIDAGDSGAAARARRWKETIRARLAQLFLLGVAPGKRLLKRGIRAAMRPVGEILRVRLSPEHDAGVPADAVTAGIVNARDPL